MKKFLTFIFVAFASQLFAQNNPITAINITLPANPDANIVNWGTGTSMLTITANAKATAGRVEPMVIESKILVIIKKNGNKICGAYTSTTAPASGFSSLTKVWTGRNAVSLLGQDCTLPPGDYELSVQFFGYGAAKVVPISDEKIKPFTIKGNDQQAYQAPQTITPIAGTVFKDADNKKPITFRWTPVIPRPAEPVTYRLSVWQLMQGQTSVQAIKANQPIFTKDVDNLTQATGSNIITGPCKPPYMCEYVWTVQALNRDGKPIGSKNGTSEINLFKYNTTPTVEATKVAITLTSPANGGKITSGLPKFSWSTKPTVDNASYQLKIVELIGNQSPEEAFRTNKPHFEKDSLNELSVNYPSSAPAFKPGKKYAWGVSIFDRWGNLKNVSGASAVSQFTANTCDVNLSLKIVSVSCLSGTKDAAKYRVCVAATYSSTVYNLAYTNAGSGFKAYHPSSSPAYAVSNISPALHVQNVGAPSTANYCIDVTVPIGQMVIKVGLLGDDNIPGPINCQAGAEVDVRLPVCATCGCGSWDQLVVNKQTKYQCGYKAIIPWKCGMAFNFTDTYHCSTPDCQAKTSWEIKKDGVNIKTGNGGASIADSFTPTANGTYTITLNSVCNGVKCPPCSYTISVRDCIDCDCGKWSPLKVQNAAGFKLYKCGAKIAGSCKSPFSFTTAYTCTSTAGRPCPAVVNWTVTLNGATVASGNATNGSFTPATNGNYLITLNALCGGKKCAPCTYTVVVKNCGPICDCGKWASDKISTIINTATGHQTKAFKCDGIWNLAAGTAGNTDIAFGNYICSSKNCVATYQWSVTGPVSSSGTGSTIHGANFSAPGTYMVSMVPICGGKKCEPCKLTVVVSRVPVCDCGKWASDKIVTSINTAAGHQSKTFKCGDIWNNVIAGTVGSVDIAFGNYMCSSKNCAATYQWSVTGPVSSSGTGSTIHGANFSAPGTYSVSMVPICGGKKCTPCKFTVVVPKVLPCDCGTWGTLNIRHASGVTVVYKCGKQIPWNCQPFSFISSYACSGPQPCRASTSWTVKLNNTTVNSGTGAGSISGTFNPTTSGTYTITLNDNCNGKRCPPCTYTVVVPPAPCPELPNGGFESILNWPSGSPSTQTNQSNVPGWKTDESDQKIEIWKGKTTTTSNSGVPAYAGVYFAEVNCTDQTAIYQTFTPACGKSIVISFAHRGRYSGADVMKVTLTNGSNVVDLGTYSATNAAWQLHSTLPVNVTGGVTYTLKFSSVSTNGGKGPNAGGNFLDAVKIVCRTVGPR